ncbi:tryptophan-rich sensory protein [Candidatus Saccharibacteria bacterium]|nr:tryptophan-rich sensory protein [Candidatus Saccharibacteria bacterium]MBQ6375704.1 tryptophan-rich sensory protein [Candidatus Saccharibacteria bacterium]
MANSKNNKNAKNKKVGGTRANVKVSNKKAKRPVKEVLIAICMILLPLIGGSIITLFTIGAQEAFGNFEQPPLAPPAWLFPVVWTILYIMMGVASYLIYRVRANKVVEKRLKVAELVLFYVQLVLNFAWTLIFFNADAKYFAFGWLIAMWCVIVTIMVMCWRNCRAAMWLLLPYLLWCTFAAYLNIAIAVLN